MRSTCPFCNDTLRGHDIERCAHERLDSEKARADAYENALAEIRVALGGSKHDEHEFVLQEVKTLVLKLDAARRLIAQAHAGLNHVGVVEGVDKWNIEAQEFLQ